MFPSPAVTDLLVKPITIAPIEPIESIQSVHVRTYPTSKYIVNRELNTWSRFSLDYSFNRYTGKVCYSHGRLPEDVKFTIYKFFTNDTPYVYHWDVTSALAVDAEDKKFMTAATAEYLALSNCSWNHHDLHQLVDLVQENKDYKKLYLIQSHLEQRNALQLDVLKTLNTDLPDTTLGQMSNRQLVDACLKSRVIGIYGLDESTSVIPRRMEYMLDNKNPQLVANRLRLLIFF
jgi:hypothetical protein